MKCGKPDSTPTMFGEVWGSIVISLMTAWCLWRPDLNHHNHIRPLLLNTGTIPSANNPFLLSNSANFTLHGYLRCRDPKHKNQIKATFLVIALRGLDAWPKTFKTSYNNSCLTGKEHTKFLLGKWGLLQNHATINTRSILSPLWKACQSWYWTW